MAWYNTTESEAADIQKTLDKFNASQDKIHVTLIAVSRADYETKLNTMAAAKQLPDTLHHGGAHDHPLRGRRPAGRRERHVQGRRSAPEVPRVHLQGQDRGLQLRGRSPCPVLQQEDVRRCQGGLSSRQRRQGVDLAAVRRCGQEAHEGPERQDAERRRLRCRRTS